jgi:hypothetical protein
MPDSQIHILTDQKFVCEHFDRILTAENSVDSTSSDRQGKAGKAQAVMNCLSDNCLFVDVDTYFAGSVGEVFDSTMNFDIAAVHDAWQFAEIYQKKSPTNRLPQHPQHHPYFNTGVIFFRNSAKVKRFLEGWLRACKMDPNDQLAFADCLYVSDLNIHTVPNVYNARTAEPIHLSGRLKILHKYSEKTKPLLNNALVDDLLSADIHNRIYLPQEGRLIVLVPYVGLQEKQRSEHTMVRENENFLHPKIEFFS